MSPQHCASPDLEEGEISEHESLTHKSRVHQVSSRHSQLDSASRRSSADHDPPKTYEAEHPTRTYASAKARKVMARTKRIGFKTQKPRTRPIEINRDRDEDRSYGTTRSRRWQQERRSNPNIRPRSIHRTSIDEGDDAPLPQEGYDYYHHTLQDDGSYENHESYPEPQPPYPEPDFERASHQTIPQHHHQPEAYQPNYHAFPQSEPHPYEPAQPLQQQQQQETHSSQTLYSSHMPPPAQLSPDYTMPQHYSQHDSQPPPAPPYYPPQPLYADHAPTMSSHSEQAAPHPYYQPDPQDRHQEVAPPHLSHHPHSANMSHHPMPDPPHEPYHLQHQQPPSHSHQIMIEDPCRHPPVTHTPLHEHIPNQNCQQPVSSDELNNGNSGEYPYMPQDHYHQPQPPPHQVTQYEYATHPPTEFQTIHDQPHALRPMIHVEPSHSQTGNEQEAGYDHYPRHDHMYSHYQEHEVHLPYHPPLSAPPQITTTDYNQTSLYSTHPEFSPSQCQAPQFQNMAPDPEAEKDEVRLLISDLVSWGVTPEYLIYIGVNKDLVWYSYHELGFEPSPRPPHLELKPCEALSPIPKVSNRDFEPSSRVEPSSSSIEDVDGVELKSHRESSLGLLLDQHTPTRVDESDWSDRTEGGPHRSILEDITVNQNGARLLGAKEDIDGSNHCTAGSADAMRKAHHQAIRMALSTKSVAQVRSLKDDLHMIFSAPLPVPEALEPLANYSSNLENLEEAGSSGEEKVTKPVPDSLGVSEQEEWARVRSLKEDLREIFPLAELDNGSQLYLADRVKAQVMVGDQTESSTTTGSHPTTTRPALDEGISSHHKPESFTSSSQSRSPETVTKLETTVGEVYLKRNREELDSPPQHSLQETSQKPRRVGRPAKKPKLNSVEVTSHETGGGATGLRRSSRAKELVERTGGVSVVPCLKIRVRALEEV